MKIYLDSIGCRLNQSEIETYARQFRAAGHTLVAAAAQADLVVVNTCAVTAAAASDSRQKIRQVSAAGNGKVIVTGCWSTLNPEAAAALPGVERVVLNPAKDRLVLDLLQVPTETFDLEPVSRVPIPGLRLRTRAFVKVQDGCDNRCTFCVTTLARGPSRSRPVTAVLADIRSALAGGAQEVILTGVHLGSWGQDFTPPHHLMQLVETILNETETPRLRLSSLEPWDLHAEFFSLWQEPRLCRHLHLPLQSGCPATLRRMARKTTPATFSALLTAARTACPDLAITTDLIAGFPGETEAEFAETLAFVQACQFAGGHVFTYSARPGTAAARLPHQVPQAVRKERNAHLRAKLQEAERTYQQRFIGQTLPVLWEAATSLAYGEWQLGGLTDNYLRVHARSPRPLWNLIVPAYLAQIERGELAGELPPQEPL